MTILNVTPDSFYSDSRTQTVEAIVRRVEEAVAEGASVLDIGGYSSRPGAADPSAEEEFRRLSVALEVVRARFAELPVSIDTFRGEVARKVVEHFGPCILNDITAALADPQMAVVAAEYDLPLIAMHMRGTPQNMQQQTLYDDLIGAIHRYFAERIASLTAAGVQQLVLDPGFGFSKTIDQNFQLLAGMASLFQDMGYPVLAGISRKSMIYKTLDTDPAGALAGTTALHWECLRQGASILRVHDTREAMQVIALYRRYCSSIQPHTVV
ncbi:MAG: dihydropteroate synthase [Alistipes sp.]|nr:dihydropteroate synthase [Alistipes sp.]